MNIRLKQSETRIEQNGLTNFKRKQCELLLPALKISALVQTIEVKGLTIPETPPSNKGLLPSLSTTPTATPVIINYYNKLTCQDYLVETVSKPPLKKILSNMQREKWEQ